MDPVDDDVAKAVGLRVRALRETRGLSLRALARRSGISVGHLSRIESGERQPSIGSLSTLAYSLEIAAGDLLGRSTDASQSLRPVGVPYDQDGLTVTPLGAGDRLASFSIQVPAGAATWPVQQHRGEECAYVVTGVLRLELDDEVQFVDTGAAAHYNAERRHRFTAHGDISVTLLLVTSPTSLAPDATR